MNVRSIGLTSVIALAVISFGSQAVVLGDMISMTSIVGAEIGDTNYNGTADTINVNPFASAVGNKSWTTGEFRTAFEFNLASLAGKIVDDAMLELNANWYAWHGDHPTGGVIELYAYVGNGTMELADYTKLDHLVWSGISDIDDANWGDLRVDVTSGLQWLIDQNATYGGFILENASVDSADDETARGWYINDYTTSTPTTDYVWLHGNVSEVPEPGSIAALLSLAGCGVGALVRRRRRTKTPAA